MNKSVVIFGGEGALGETVVKQFLSNGANVVVGYHNEEKWACLAEAVGEKGNSILGIQVEVTNEASVKAAVDLCANTHGRVDAMIYLAGVFFVGPPIWETSIEKLTEMIQVNTIGAVAACKHAIPHMLAQNSGNIIFMPAKSVLVGKAHFGTYAVSKGALITLMENLTEELRETNIAVNCVMPDAIVTPITLHAPHAEPDKWVTTEEVAEVILGACYSKGNIIRGSVLKCYGK